MGFRTKVDMSDNRQVKQYERSDTFMSGSTTLGLPFDMLTSGADMNTTGITHTITGITSAFSGNSATTVFIWYDPLMQMCEPYINTITYLNTGTTQHLPLVTTTDTTTIIDGNTVTLTYGGVSFDITPTNITDYGGGVMMGDLYTTRLDIYSAGTLDYTGRTIWLNVSGITNTDRLIIQRGASVGDVWTCTDTQGMGSWQPASGASNLWSASTGTNAITVKNRHSIASGPNSTSESYYGIAFGESSHAEGYMTSAVGNFSHSSGYMTSSSGTSSYAGGYQCSTKDDYSHAEGYKNTTIGKYSFAGGSNSVASGATSFVYGSNSVAANDGTIVLGVSLTGTQANYTYVNSLNVNFINTTPHVYDLRVDANGNLTTNTSDVRLKENIRPIENALLTLSEVNGVIYQWKDKNAGGHGDKLGFIAQEVEPIIPQLVFTNNRTEYKGVHTDGFIPLLVEAVKELDSKKISTHTPKSSQDTHGVKGDLTYDNNYLYIKTDDGWKRISLETF